MSETTTYIDALIEIDKRRHGVVAENDIVMRFPLPDDPLEWVRTLFGALFAHTVTVTAARRDPKGAPKYIVETDHGEVSFAVFHTEGALNVYVCVPAAWDVRGPLGEILVNAPRMGLTYQGRSANKREHLWRGRVMESA